MNALVRTGKCEAALEVFREMIKRKLKPGLVACNFVLTNCSKHKQGAVALAFLDLMKEVPFKLLYFLIFFWGGEAVFLGGGGEGFSSLVLHQF